MCKAKGVQEVAGALNVRYVLEGSVRKAGNNLRITVRLVDAAMGAHLWAEKYSGTLQNVFDLQEQLSQRIVQALSVTLTPEERRRLSARSVSDPRALDAWFHVRHVIFGLTRSELDRARQIAIQALALVGNCPPLHAALGWILVNYYAS